MLFKHTGDERLSLVLRKSSYPFLSEEDLKSPFSDIPTFLSTDMGDENYCDYSKLEDLNTPTPLDGLDTQFNYEYPHLNEIKMEEDSSTNHLNRFDIPIRQTRSADEFQNIDLIRNIKSEYVDDPNSDYAYYAEPRDQTGMTYSSWCYSTDPSIPCTQSYPRDLYTCNPVQQHPDPHHPNPPPHPHVPYQPDFFEPCYIEASTPSYYPNPSPYTTCSATVPVYHNLNSAHPMTWDNSTTMYSPDSGVCTASPNNTHPSPYALSSSSYSNRSDLGDLESDILHLTPSTTQPVPMCSPSSRPSPNHAVQPVLGRQTSAPLPIEPQDLPKPNNNRPRVKIADSQKPFLCGMNNCPKRFVRIDELKRHQRTHSSVRQFVCEDCQKGFTRSDHLTTHRRTHTGERPYACSICDRRFARSDEKNRHEKTHSKERSRAGRKPREFKQAGDLVVRMAHSL